MARPRDFDKILKNESASWKASNAENAKAKNVLSVLRLDSCHDPIRDLIEENEMRDKINLAFAKLAFREREILKLRLGFVDGYTYTYEEICRKFKIVRERVRQLEAKGLRILHFHLLVSLDSEERKRLTPI